MQVKYPSLAPWWPVRLAIAFVFLASLVACGNPPVKPAAVEAATAVTGGLLVVRLERVFEPPAAILLDVGSEGRPEKAQFAGKLKQSFPGRHADYLVALSLPPGQYLLTGLRSSGNAATGDVTLNVTFTVAQGNPDYLGRLVLTTDPASSQASLRIENHHEEDTLLFRTTLSKLKDLAIGNALIQMDPKLAAPLGEFNATPPAASTVANTTAADKKQIALTPLTPRAASLLGKADRPAFDKFLQFKSPRAFATNRAGARGIASGPTAAQTALSRCNSQARANVCRLFAVDDLLLDLNDANAPTFPAPSVVPAPTATPARTKPATAATAPLKAPALAERPSAPSEPAANVALEQPPRVGSRAEAKAMVDAAVEHVKKVGSVQAFKDFSDKGNKAWHQRDLYVFAYNLEGVNVAHGANDKLVGKNLIEMEDPEGKLLIRELRNMAVKGGGWVEYEWPHPHTKKIESKISYVRKLNNYDGFVGVGVYR